MVSVAEKDLPEGTLVMLLDPNNKAMNKNEPPMRESTASRHETPKAPTLWWTKLATPYTAMWTANG